MEEQQHHDAAPDCAHCEEYRNNWKRAVADYQNLQKDLARERQQMRVYAVSHAAELFLPVYDHFRMAFDHVPPGVAKEGTPWLSGLAHIRTQYEQALQALGLLEVPTDGALDTRWHEVVSYESREDVPDETIVRVVQPGYTCNGTVVRPAKVVVAKNTSTAQPPQDIHS